MEETHAPAEIPHRGLFQRILVFCEAHDLEGRIMLGLGLAASVFIMGLPLWLITRYSSPLETAAASGSAAVGVGAMIRGISRDILRTSVTVASRAAAQSVSHHWTHLVVNWFASLVGWERPESEEPAVPHPIFSIAVGTIALVLSYMTILELLEPGTRAEVLGPTSLKLASFLVAIPLLVYYALAYTAGRLCSVSITPRTEVDGLLLQLYFTFAMSFLPLTSDAEYSGSRRACMNAAAFTLTSMLLLHLGLHALATALGIYWMSQLSVLFLLHVFVLSFPLHPLDGSTIWRHNKLVWLMVWLPVAFSFHFNMPKVFYEFI